MEFRAAVEFMRMHDHLLSRDARGSVHPKAMEKVSERVAGLMQRALAENWTVRRVEEHCATVRLGRANGRRDPKTIPTFASALDVSSAKIVVDRKRLAALNEEERRTLTERLLALLQESSEACVHMDAPATEGATAPATSGATEG